jgi:hypothetical protein
LAKDCTVFLAVAESAGTGVAEDAVAVASAGADLIAGLLIMCLSDAAGGCPPTAVVS